MKNLRVVIALVGIVFLAAATCQAAPEPKTHAPFKMTMWTFSPGSTSYILAFNMAQLVNLNSDWLKVEAREGAGSGKHITDFTNKLEVRKDTLFHSPDSSIAAARSGISPFKKPYAGARVVIAQYDSNQIWVTYDKSIRTKEDFKGKRVMFMPKFISTGLGFDVLLKEVWKIGDDVKISYGFFGPGTRALRDGVVDVAMVSTNGMGDVWNLSPDAARLAAEKPGFHPVSIPAADILAVNKASGWLFHPVTHPAGSFKDLKVDAPEAFTGMANMLAYWADESMDEDAVYEFVKTVYEHMDEMKKRFPGMYLTQKNMASVPVPQDWFHPGALKFYKERNVSVGAQ